MFDSHGMPLKSVSTWWLKAVKTSFFLLRDDAGCELFPPDPSRGWCCVEGSVPTSLAHFSVFIRPKGFFKKCAAVSRRGPQRGRHHRCRVSNTLVSFFFLLTSQEHFYCKYSQPCCVSSHLSLIQRMYKRAYGLK